MPKKIQVQSKNVATPVATSATVAAVPARKATQVQSAVPKAESVPIVVVVQSEAVEAKTDDSSVEVSVISNEISQIYKDLSEATTLIRNITQRMKCLEREIKKENRVLQKLQTKNRKRSVNQAPRGFAKPTRISDTMAKFFGVPIGTEMARTEASKLIIKYVQEKQLVNVENKKAFKPDKALQSILSPLKDEDKNGDGYTYFNLQHYIRNNFSSAANSATTKTA